MISDENGSEDNDADTLWNEITKDINKLEQERSLTAEQEDEPEKTRTPAKRRKLSKTPTLKPRVLQQTEQSSAGSYNAGLDRNTAERLRRGQLPIEARLDLHGMTREKAELALSQFLHAQYVAGRRCVLVITGKGPGKDGRRDPLNEGYGVLRQSVPQWLSAPPNRSLVLKTAPAKAQHGGAGALYVLLRRKRT